MEIKKGGFESQTKFVFVKSKKETGIRIILHKSHKIPHPRAAQRASRTTLNSSDKRFGFKIGLVYLSKDMANEDSWFQNAMRYEIGVSYNWSKFFIEIDYNNMSLNVPDSSFHTIGYDLNVRMHVVDIDDGFRNSIVRFLRYSIAVGFSPNSSNSIFDDEKVATSIGFNANIGIEFLFTRYFFFRTGVTYHHLIPNNFFIPDIPAPFGYSFDLVFTS